MKINSIHISNFRILQDAHLNIEDDVTIIVGKNNTGKTSLFEAIKIFTTNDEKISFEEFSQSSYDRFKECLKLFLKFQVETNEEIKEQMELALKRDVPKIQITLLLEYNPDNDSLINLSEFITDLDENRNDATVLISFEPKDTLRLFNAYLNHNPKSLDLILFLKENISQYYHLSCYAVDKDSDYRQLIEGNFKDKIKKIVAFEDIKALRVLDDKKGDRNNTLALGFSKYYRERDKDKDDVLKLEETLNKVSADLKKDYEVVLEDILLDLKEFGAETPIIMPDIEINSEFDSETVIKNNIKYYYKHKEISLPESYNGLGYSNLIYMILEFTSFIERVKNSKDEKSSEFLTVLIEEPEAHMHPQMQQVFIKQIMKKLVKAKNDGIYIQLIMTSHSTHIIVEAGIDLDKGFDRIRYFYKNDNSIEIKDFNKFRHLDNDKATFRFLKQYLNLHKCDLFFADKIIMVEGVTEKLLLPQMIAKVAPSLISEYISVLEVGGAYTHKFKNLLDFIKVKTLIITDLDSVDSASKNECKVNNGDNGEITSNETLKNWIPKLTNIKELINCEESQKLHDDIICITYQIPEVSGGYVARSLEESIINCNKAFFGKTKEILQGDVMVTTSLKNSFSLLKSQYTIEKINELEAWDLRPLSSSSKTNFAFDLMTFDELVFEDWQVPKYIKDGLEWLAGRCIYNPEKI